MIQQRVMELERQMAKQEVLMDLLEGQVKDLSARVTVMETVAGVAEDAPDEVIEETGRPAED